MIIILVTMSSIKDKYILLLGILSNHTIHGYQLNQMLKSQTNAIIIGKANAYKLLAKLEESGFVTHVKEHLNNRPTRLVYSITILGKEEFKCLIRDRLSKFQPIEYPDGVSLNFIELLKPQEALPLLKKKQVHLAIRCKALAGFSDEILASHPGIDFLVLQANLENKFLKKLIQKIENKIKELNNA